MRIAHRRGEPGTFVVELYAVSKEKFCHVKF